MITKDIHQLTPITEQNGVLYKRDDWFAPFGLTEPNGGKLRQAWSLLLRNADTIRKHHNNTVVCQTSIHSSTGAWTAKVAQMLGMRCIVCVGGSNQDRLTEHHMMALATRYGADCRNVAGTGMSGTVMSRLYKIVENEGAWNACFEDNWEQFPDCLLDVTSYQVQNLPDDLDVLVIPCGGGIQMSGILRGLVRYGKKVGRVLGCHVGPDRRKAIDSRIEPLEYGRPVYELVPLNTVYSKPETFLLDGIPMDEIYEAKAAKWMLQNIDTKNRRTMLWVVGRRPTYMDVFGKEKQ